MADYYKEQIIKTDMDSKKRIIGTIACSLLAFLGLIFGTIGLIVVAILFLIDYKFTKLVTPAVFDRKLELEYIATNGTFEIDTIINKARRRKEIEIEMKDVVCFGKLESQKVLGQSHQTEVKDLSNRNNSNNDDKYVFIVMNNSKKTKVIFEPNEDMIQIFKVFVPKHAMEA